MQTSPSAPEFVYSIYVEGQQKADKTQKDLSAFCCPSILIIFKKENVQFSGGSQHE